MSIQDLGSIGEFLAALATIATLIYLAFQIRQNTSLAQTQFMSSSIESLRPFQLWRAENENNARVYREGLMDFGSVSLDERVMLDGLLHAQLMQIADARAAFDKGFLDREIYEGYMFYVASLLNMPGATKWWTENKVFYSTTGLDALIDEQRKSTPPYHKLAPSSWVEA